MFVQINYLRNNLNFADFSIYPKCNPHISIYANYLNLFDFSQILSHSRIISF